MAIIADANALSGNAPSSSALAKNPGWRRRGPAQSTDHAIATPTGDHTTMFPNINHMKLATLSSCSGNATDSIALTAMPQRIPRAITGQVRRFPRRAKLLMDVAFMTLKKHAGAEQSRGRPEARCVLS